MKEINKRQRLTIFFKSKYEEQIVVTIKQNTSKISKSQETSQMTSIYTWQIKEELPKYCHFQNKENNQSVLVV